MKKNLNLFFLWSDFHYIICKSIIKQYHLDENYCYFIPDRDVKLEDDFKSPPSILNKVLNTRFCLRPFVYLKNKKEIDLYLKGRNLTVYTPFVYSFTRYPRCNVVWYEEGFSSRFIKYDADKDNKINLIKGFVLYNISRLICKSDARRAFFFGFYSVSNTPREGTTLITTSSRSYSFLTSPFVNKLLLDIDIARKSFYAIPEGSYVLVLDRFIEGGRPFNINTYLQCLKKEIEFVVNRHVKTVWYKFHPADTEEPSSKNLFYDFIKDYDIEFKIFNGKLEFLALQDIGAHFIGTNSTLLYYAPLLGKSNVSFSYSRFLASIDEKYDEFMKNWGGIDDFVEIFSKNVTCV